MYLLTTDWHLSENDADAYRWQVFDAVAKIKAEHKVSHSFVLGDALDRKDRFSAAFVNRLVDSLIGISPVSILRGNHDTTVQPPSYLAFLTDTFLQPYVHYVDEPTEFTEDLLMLPFSPRPRQDWQHLGLAQYRAVLMHATVNGATAENGQVLEGMPMGLLPKGPRYYSGDVHVPQQAGRVTYVGCPHPVHFGDAYPCRMLLIDEQTLDVVKQIDLAPPRKLMVDIHSVDQLTRIRARRGDQVKIRFHGLPAGVTEFGEVEQQLIAWAKRHGVTIASTEVNLTSTYDRTVDTEQSPEAILRQYASHEGLTEELTEMGVSLLKEVM